MSEEKKQYPWLPEGKEFIVAILLCIFLGTLGIHNFYLGEKKKGLLKLIATVAGALIIVGPGFSAVLALIDLIKMVSNSYVVSEEKYI